MGHLEHSFESSTPNFQVREYIALIYDQKNHNLFADDVLKDTNTRGPTMAQSVSLTVPHITSK